MEDGDDKIRRNVVVASAIVLLVAWLDLPVQGLAEKLFSVKSDEASKIALWKVWSAVLALILYLGLRYRFSPAAKQAFEDVRAVWIERCLSDGSAIVQLDLLRMLNFEERSAVYRGDPLKFLDPVGERDHDPSKRVFKVEPQFEGRSWWRGTARILESADGSTVERISDAPFEIPLLTRLWTRIRILARMALYSELSLEFLVPATLAVVAAIVCATRLVGQLL
jgi:hypothetical protein